MLHGWSYCLQACGEETNRCYYKLGSELPENLRENRTGLS